MVRGVYQIITVQRSEHMKKFLKSILLFILIGLLCGCIDENDLTKPEADNRPDIYVRDSYKDLKKGDGNISGRYGIPLFAVENGEIIYTLENDSVYKYESGKKELVFKVEEEENTRIGSLVYASDDYIIYLMMDTKSDGEYNVHSSDTIWKYSFESKNRQQIIDKHFSSFISIVVDNTIIIRDDSNFYFADIETLEYEVIEDYNDKTEEELNDLLPTGFYSKKYKGKQYDSFELFFEGNGSNERVGFIYYYDEDNEEMIDINEVLDASLWLKTNCYDGKIYAFYLNSEVIKQGGDNYLMLRYGNSEGCETKHWISDEICFVDGPNYHSSEKQSLYKDSNNRILGYNPDTNEVYLYVFDNHSITAKDLDDQSEKTVETLDEADAIKFEWYDTRLYWIYDKNGVEEYGGCHEFGD